MVTELLYHLITGVRAVPKDARFITDPHSGVPITIATQEIADTTVPEFENRDFMTKEMP